jgi:transposase
MSDTELERLIYPRTARDIANRATEPDWPCVHRELRRKGVTLMLLWEEYRADHPDGYGYSRFCELYTRWEGRGPAGRQQQVPLCRRAAPEGHRGP